MKDLALLVGPPGQAYDAVRDVLAAQPDALVVLESHLMTPVAYLGYYDKVYKAPYDHVLAAEAQRLFVEQLPRKAEDYNDACRAYAASLYDRAREAAGKRLLVDATPEYALILPFLRRVLPEARYVLVVQHPLALLSENPEADIPRYVAAIGRFLANPGVPALHLRQEDLLYDRTATVERLLNFLDLPPDPQAQPEATAHAVAPVEPWARAFHAEGRIPEAQHLFRRLDPDELAAYGYGSEDFWSPIERATGRPVHRPEPGQYAKLQRRAVGSLRQATRRHGLLNRLVRKTKLACDVLLREQ
jgi:hypothetical protein